MPNETQPALTRAQLIDDLLNISHVYEARLKRKVLEDYLDAQLTAVTAERDAALEAHEQASRLVTAIGIERDEIEYERDKTACEYARYRASVEKTEMHDLRAELRGSARVQSIFASKLNAVTAERDAMQRRAEAAEERATLVERLFAYSGVDNYFQISGTLRITANMRNRNTWSIYSSSNGYWTGHGWLLTDPREIYSTPYAAYRAAIAAGLVEDKNNV